MYDRLHVLSLVSLLPHLTEAFLTGQRGELGKDEQFSLPLSMQEKSSLTNEEFEEIVQIVIQKSLQECLGMAYSERKRVSVRQRNCYLGC